MRHTLVLQGVMIAADIVDTAVCGGYDGSFKCDIHIESSDLDSNGFVYDNSSLIDSLKTRFAKDKLKASCEELGNGIIRHVWEMFEEQDREFSLQRVIVKVYNKTGYVESSFDRGTRSDEVPNFPETPSKKTLRERSSAPYRKEPSGFETSYSRPRSGC